MAGAVASPNRWATSLSKAGNLVDFTLVGRALVGVALEADLANFAKYGSTILVRALPISVRKFTSGGLLHNVVTISGR